MEEIEELAKTFHKIKNELNNKIEEYVINILHKFNDDFIEFDSEQRQLTRYFYDGSIKTLVAIELDYYNSVYVKLVFEDEYDNKYIALLAEMDIDKQIDILDNIEMYIKKYGYKNTNDI